MKEKEEAKAKKGAGEKEKRMGAPKQKWTSEEEEALVSGVNKHGAGKWRTIQKDPEFSQHLSTRSNIDLKDKWRNMSVSAGGQGPREKVKTPKPKSLPAPPFTPAGLPWSSTPSQAVEGAPTPALDSARSPQDAKISPVMILEALTTLNEPNGVDISAIRNFIEQKHEIPANKRLLGAKLRRLITQNKAEKIDKGGYKVKDSSSFATKMPTPKQKEPGIRLSRQQAQNPGGTNKSTEAPDCIEQTADAIAYRISDAESKSYLAAQAVKDLEMIRSLVDEQEALTLLAQEIFERCKQGEIVTLAKNWRHLP